MRSSNCKKCNSSSTKSGFINNVQRYKCKNCGYQFTINEEKKRGKPLWMKKKALHLYLEGVEMRKIAKILGVSDIAIAKWIKNIQELILELHNEKPFCHSQASIPSHVKNYLDGRDKQKKKKILVIEYENEKPEESESFTIISKNKIQKETIL